MATRDEPTAPADFRAHLTSADLSLLASIHADASGAVDATAERLRDDPRVLREALRSDATHEALLPRGPKAAAAEPLLRASPFLVFAVAVHRLHADLATESYVDEWVGARQRLPVFATPELRALLDDERVRLFLAELLASYTHVTSGTVWVSTPRGPRRQRVSDLDLRRLSALLDVLPIAQQPRVHRRLGDLTLLLTGVFPDHTASRAFGDIDLYCFARAVADSSVPELAEALETRGAVGLLEVLGSRWYELAHTGTQRPAQGTGAILPTVAERFEDVRRVLNLLTDRYLFPFRSHWFPASGG